MSTTGVTDKESKVHTRKTAYTIDPNKPKKRRVRKTPTAKTADTVDPDVVGITSGIGNMTVKDTQIDDLLAKLRKEIEEHHKGALANNATGASIARSDDNLDKVHQNVAQAKVQVDEMNSPCLLFMFPCCKPSKCCTPDHEHEHASEHNSKLPAPPSFTFADPATLKTKDDKERECLRMSEFLKQEAILNGRELDYQTDELRRMHQGETATTAQADKVDQTTKKVINKSKP